MRKLAAGELMALSKMLQMETTALKLGKAQAALVTDDELKALTEDGLAHVEVRVKGLQQFIADNDVL